MAHLPSMRSCLSRSAAVIGVKPTEPTTHTPTPRHPQQPHMGIGIGTSPSTRPLDQVSLVAALGKEVSPQMVQALQAVAARRESFSSAAKLYAVSVTTLWRYSKKLGLSEPTQHSK
ncbi:hypothetical protein Pcinc_040824 [Petrolisthes cinctipes]|uniref:HTH psq-type domain-containing protein n=1 Tax=Petrolisthes cinctipes TaxID=88211 RepID=A0AAE1BKS0_PETCI|nr:hypothetical protein Pcinc_040824 [Petrolisthes cinctipes]